MKSRLVGGGRELCLTWKARNDLQISYECCGYDDRRFCISQGTIWRKSLCFGAPQSSNQNPVQFRAPPDASILCLAGRDARRCTGSTVAVGGRITESLKRMYNRPTASRGRQRVRGRSEHCAVCERGFHCLCDEIASGLEPGVSRAAAPEW